jgi:hypothetical protein
VLEFNSDFAAVSVLVGFNHLLKFPLLLLSKNATLSGALNEKLPFQVCFSKPVLFVVQRVLNLSNWESEFLFVGVQVFVNLLQLQRVKVSKKMAVCFVRV